MPRLCLHLSISTRESPARAIFAHKSTFGQRITHRDPELRAVPIGYSIEEQVLRINVKRFRGGPVFKAHRPVYHSTLGSRVIKKKSKYRKRLGCQGAAAPPSSETGPAAPAAGPSLRPAATGRPDPVQGSGSRVQGPGSRVQGPGSRVHCSGSRVQGSGSRAQGPGSRVQGSLPSSSDLFKAQHEMF